MPTVRHLPKPTQAGGRIGARKALHNLGVGAGAFGFLPSVEPKSPQPPPPLIVHRHHSNSARRRRPRAHYLRARTRRRWGLPSLLRRPSLKTPTQPPKCVGSARCKLLGRPHTHRPLLFGGERLWPLVANGGSAIASPLSATSRHDYLSATAQKQRREGRQLLKRSRLRLRLSAGAHAARTPLFPKRSRLRLRLLAGAHAARTPLYFASPRPSRSGVRARERYELVAP